MSNIKVTRNGTFFFFFSRSGSVTCGDEKGEKVRLEWWGGRIVKA